MNMKAKPFCLRDEQIQWVQDTLSPMTEDEKIGQLFLPIAFSSDENYLRYEMLRYHIGGVLFKTSPSKEVRSALRFMQETAGSRFCAQPIWNSVPRVFFRTAPCSASSWASARQPGACLPHGLRLL